MCMRAAESEIVPRCQSTRTPSKNGNGHSVIHNGVPPTSAQRFLARRNRHQGGLSQHKCEYERESGRQEEPKKFLIQELREIALLKRGVSG